MAWNVVVQGKLSKENVSGYYFGIFFVHSASQVRVRTTYYARLFVVLGFWKSARRNVATAKGHTT